MASRFPLPAPSASRPRALVSSAILRRFILPAARACRLSSAAAQPRARRTYACWWQDAIGREIAAADYGTNGGAALVRPEVPPASSETVLVTRTVHASTGEPGSVIDPMGTVTRWKRDAIGREIETIENFREGAAPAADVNRTTRFGYHPSGGLETLTLVNDVTGDQTTRWLYGTSLENSGLASGNLLRAKIYPGGDRSDYAHNKQGEVVRSEDGNGTVHELLRDKMGRMRHDSVTAVGEGIAEAVRRISTEYDPKRPSLVATVTSYDDPTPGEGNVLNQVAKAHDGFGQEIDDAQAHGGAVDGSTPKVAYGYADGSSGNTARRESITYPNGRQIDLDYGAAGSIEDSFSLVKSVAIHGETGDKVAYTRVGLGRFVEIAYPQPGVRMNMIRPGGGSEGDAGDPYDGFDRFSRTQAMRWEKTSDGSVLDGWQWGFNQASNRTWKKNLVAATGQDEAYGYDRLYQVVRDAVGTLNTNRTAIGGVPEEDEVFTYDPTGNWLAYRKDADGSPVLDQTRSNNQDNQLTQIDGSSQGIEYDKAGNAVKIRPGLDGDWSKHFELVWDAWNRLVEVKDENGVTVQKHRYDGLTRRITKTAEGVDTHYYYNDRWKCVEERLDSPTTAARSYLWGERPGHRDELVLRDRDTNGDGTLDERLYATMDYFNGTAILGVAGEVLERYAYAAFGPKRVMAPDFSPRTASNFDWDFGFQGQFRDAETGWYNYGYRFYMPLLGRWINRDPIAERGGVSLYVFVENGPTGKSDIFGLSSCNSDTLGHYRTSNENIKIETGGGELNVNPLKMLEKFHEEVAKGGAREQARKKPWMEQAMEVFDEVKGAADGALKRMQLNSTIGVLLSVTVEFDVECCTCDSSGNYFWKPGGPVSETEDVGAEQPPYPSLPTAAAAALKAAGDAAKMQCSTKE